MYVQSGLGRRGLGDAASDAATYAALLAAGNPTCTCYMGSCLESGNSCSSPAVTPTPTSLTASSLTAWLNSNSTYLCIGVVAALGLLMLGKAR